VYNEAYPFFRDNSLLDIVNVPGKTGADVLSALEKQLARIGMYKSDIISGCGDGGGENEGTLGIHNLLSVSNSDYVKHRCLPHFGWRTNKAGANKMPHYDDTKALNSYLRQGVTWSRLSSLAVQPVAAGGLAMFRENSPEHVAIFGTQPPKVIDDRPETDADWLDWLLPKQSVLVPLIEADLASRKLKGDDGQQGLSTLKDKRACMLRHIDLVMMKKSMFMYYWTKKHNHVAACTQFASLVDKTVDAITSTRVTQDVLDALHLSRGDLETMGMHDETTLHWIEVAICLVPGVGRDDVDDILSDAMEYHKSISLAMSSHVRTTADGIVRYYLPAAILSKDPTVARVTARLFHSHLLRQNARTATPFETAVLNDSTLMTQLGKFCDVDPPILLWKGCGIFKELFHFLAVRYLSCPDHVLDCEGVHALWKWIELNKRGVSFKMLNAILKSQFYLRSHAGEFPDQDELNPCLLSVIKGHLRQVNAVRASGEVAIGATSRHIYASRFNLRGSDIDLLKQAARADPELENDRDARTAWSNYVRFIFDVNHFYVVNESGHQDAKYFLIAKVQAAPSTRIVREGETKGRKLAIAWFEAVSEDADGLHVRPVAGRLGGLELVSLSVAEISKASGIYPVLAADATPADEEARHELGFLNHEVLHFESTRNTDAECPWGFTLSNPTNIEEYTFASRPLQKLTKMALSRHLQRSEGSSDAVRDARWNLPVTALLAAVDADATGVAVPAPARGLGARGGRGRGAARGHGGKGAGIAKGAKGKGGAGAPHAGGDHKGGKKGMRGRRGRG
jgi:hypothetical protein